jgi:hypothetical protein
MPPLPLRRGFRRYASRRWSIPTRNVLVKLVIAARVFIVFLGFLECLNGAYTTAKHKQTHYRVRYESTAWGFGSG